MSDDDILHFLVARVQSRDNTMITFSAIASSASLIFLGVIWDFEKLGEIPLEYILLGIIIPSITFAHHELTRLGIQKNDHKEINKILLNRTALEWELRRLKKIIKYTRYRDIRLFLAFVLFMSPVLAWLFVIPYKIGIEGTTVQLLFDILSIVGVMVIILWRKCVKDMSDDCKDD